MNMFCIKKIASFVIIISFCFISCDQSGDKENTTANAPSNTAETPVIVPDNSVTADATTVYNIWVLDSINGKAPDSNYFAHGTPYFDFNLEKNTVNGHTGCNGLTGKLKVQDQRLIFDSLVITSQVCNGKGKEFEKKLLAGFRSGKTTYKIQNEMLYLNVGSGSNFTFRKIRR